MSSKRSTLGRSSSRVKDLQRMFDTGKKESNRSQEVSRTPSSPYLPALVRDHTVRKDYRKPVFGQISEPLESGRFRPPESSYHADPPPSPPAQEQSHEQQHQTPFRSRNRSKISESTEDEDDSHSTSTQTPKQSRTLLSRKLSYTERSAAIASGRNFSRLHMGRSSSFAFRSGSSGQSQSSLEEVRDSHPPVTHLPPRSPHDSRPPSGMSRNYSFPNADTRETINEDDAKEESDGSGGNAAQAHIVPSLSSYRRRGPYRPQSLRDKYRTTYNIPSDRFKEIYKPKEVEAEAKHVQKEQSPPRQTFNQKQFDSDSSDDENDNKDNDTIEDMYSRAFDDQEVLEDNQPNSVHFSVEERRVRDYATVPINTEDSTEEENEYTVPQDSVKPFRFSGAESPGRSSLEKSKVNHEESESSDEEASKSFHTAHVSRNLSPPSPEVISNPRGTEPISFTSLVPDDYVGFSRLPEQIYKKSIRSGFELNLLLVGEEGLGKQTLINSLFKRDLAGGRNSQHIEIIGELRKTELTLEENNVRLKLRIIDIPNFAGGIDNSDCWNPIVEYIDQNFMQYMRDESNIHRCSIQDTRPHVCLYFLPPTGHGLRDLDVKVLQSLHKKVNIIPVLAKADSFTAPELREYKRKVTEDFENFDIEVFSEVLSVIGATKSQDQEYGELKRMYSWGEIDIENPDYCDFSKLRSLLLHERTLDLIERTHRELYHNFRATTLTNINYAQVLKGDKVESKRLKHMEAEMERVLQDKVEKRRQRLLQYKDSEEKSLEVEFKQLEAEKIDLAQRKNNFQQWKVSQMNMDHCDPDGDGSEDRDQSRNLMGLMTLRRIRKK